MNKLLLLAVATASTVSSVFAGSCHITPVCPPEPCVVRPVCKVVLPPPPEPCYVKPVCRILPPSPLPICPPVHPPCRITVCPVPQPVCPPQPCRITCTPVTPPPCDTVCIPTCRIRVCELPPPPACSCHKPVCSCKKTVQVCSIRVCEKPIAHHPATNPHVEPIVSEPAYHAPEPPVAPLAPAESVIPEPPVQAPEVQAGQEVTIDGASFGQQQGSVVLNVGGMRLQAQVTSWTNNEVRAILPSLPLSAAANATVNVVAPTGQVTQQLAVLLTADPTLLAQR